MTDTAVARDLSKEFALMSLYGQRTQRACEKYKQELNELQEKRKADEAEQLEEARLLNRKRNNLPEITRTEGKAA